MIGPVKNKSAEAFIATDIKGKLHQLNIQLLVENQYYIYTMFFLNY